MTARRLLTIAGFASLAALLALVAVFDPAEYSFWPDCAFHETTGLYCPGCGFGRALHRALTGDLIAAFRLNAMALLIAPAALWALAARTINLAFGTRLNELPLTVRSAWWIAGIVIAFGVLRNIPHEPFSLLAPGGGFGG